MGKGAYNSLLTSKVPHACSHQSLPDDARGARSAYLCDECGVRKHRVAYRERCMHDCSLDTCITCGRVRLTTEQCIGHISLPPVTLLLAPPRPKVLARLLAHVSALGVSHVLLTGATCVQRTYFDATALKQPVMDTACEKGVQQAAVDVCVPSVFKHRVLVDALHSVSDMQNSFRIVLNGTASRTLREVLSDEKHAESPRQYVVLAVGPERGWTDDELACMCDQFGFMDATLGERVLTADVATIVAITLVHDYLGSLQQHVHAQQPCVLVGHHTKRPERVQCRVRPDDELCECCKHEPPTHSVDTQTPP